MNTIQRVLIIHTDGNTFNNPTLKCLVDLLLKKAVLVDIRYPITNSPMPAISGVTLLPWSRAHHKLLQIICNRLNSWWLTFFFVLLERIFFVKKSYNLVIGVDRIGIIEAGILSKINGFPVVFFSFEIMFSSETSKSYKQLEIKASKYISHWFIQDELRAKWLAVENKLSTHNKTLIPLASAGYGVLSKDRLRDKLGIPKNKKVAMLMGSLSDWTMAEDIIKSVVSWPQDWVLIVHERYGKTKLFIKEIGLNLEVGDCQKLFFSDYATDFVDDMGCVLSGITVGLAFYSPCYRSPYIGNNLKYLGLASGKIATFLRYSVPVIINEIGLYADNLKKYDFGCVVSDVAQIGLRLENEDWIGKGRNARKFFDSFLDFAIYENQVWDVIKNSSKSLK